MENTLPECVKDNRLDSLPVVKVKVDLVHLSRIGLYWIHGSDRLLPVEGHALVLLVGSKF